MTSEHLPPISRPEAVEMLDPAGHAETVCRGLVRVALHEEDPAWALGRIAPFLSHPRPEIRDAAVASVGFLVRIHRSIDVTRVLPVLFALQADPHVARRVRDTLKDIRQFTRAA